MKRLINVLAMILSFSAGAVFACEADCPPLEKIERGVYNICENCGTAGAPSSGTIDIRETEVEIVYPDASNNEWHVVYKITGEE